MTKYIQTRRKSGIYNNVILNVSNKTPVVTNLSHLYMVLLKIANCMSKDCQKNAKNFLKNRQFLAIVKTNFKCLAIFFKCQVFGNFLTFNKCNFFWVSVVYSPGWGSCPRREWELRSLASPEGTPCGASCEDSSNNSWGTLVPCTDRPRSWGETQGLYCEVVR